VERCAAYLNAPKDAAPLVAFRIIFGALMAFESFASYLHKIPEHYSPDLHHFTYAGFHWVAPPGGAGIYAVVAAMGLAAFCVTIGYRYRIAALAYALLYSYLFLIERTAYNNHYYLIILLSFMFVAVNAHADASLDSGRFPPGKRGWVPAWQIDIFRAQFALVYFFGGVAKLSPDWLRREPITHWLGVRAEHLIAGPVLELAFVPYLLAYGGLVFDLTIGFLLLWKRTRPAAIVLAVAFHLTNAYLFSIGVFPWLGIGALVLFLEGGSVRGILTRMGYAAGTVQFPSVAFGLRSRWPLAFCTVYLLLQCLVPLRHWCYPGDVNWTEQGHEFSWRMKLRDKEGQIRFRVEDRATGRSDVLDFWALQDFLTVRQIRDVSCKPELAAQFARHLRARYIERGFVDPGIYADSLVSLNGRPYQPLLNPAVDLASLNEGRWRAAAWLLPLDPHAAPGLYPPPPETFNR